jgi:uncharacterized protein YjdB
MKRVLSVFLAVIMVFSMTMTAGISVSAEQSGDFTYSNSGSGVKIVKYTGTGGSVKIPGTIGSSAVTTIGEYAFESCKGLTSVSIPDTVTLIDNCAFLSCSGLKSVIIPKSVATVAYRAFEECRGLTDVKLSAGVKIIGDNAFKYCEKIAAITIPDGVISIGQDAFYNCSKIKSVVIPNSVTSVGNGAFESCAALTQINVETSNAEYQSQSGVLFNKTITTLLQYPSGKTGNYTIPDTVTSVIAFAFNNSTELTAVIIPGSVTYIAYGAFNGCKKLDRAIFLGDAPTMDLNVFKLCSSSFKVYYIDGKSGYANPWNGYSAVEKEDVPVTSVMLDKTSASLKIPQTLQLTATVYPSNTINDTVTWTSGNGKVASVSSSGIVTLKGPGKAVITVTTVSGGKKATCTVTVTQPVKSVKLNKSALTLTKGKTFKLVATVSPSNSSNKKVTWKSGNKKIVTVSTTGVVKGIKKGSAYINVYTVDGKKSAKCKVTIK